MEEKKNKKNIFQKLWARKWLILILTIVVLIGWFYWKRSRQQKNGFEEDTIQKGEVRQELVLTGEIDAIERASLSFETSGKLAYVGVQEGQEVKRGVLLGNLETTALNAAYEQARNNLRQYEANVDYVHDNVKDNDKDESFSEKNTRTAAEVLKDNAYEAMIIAERSLKGASLYTPFDGIVTYIANPFSGPFVLATQPQFEIVNPETIYFSVTADQTEVTSITKGMEVLVTLDSFPDKQIKGEVLEIDFAPDPSEVGVVYEIKVSLPELSEIDYRLNMTGDAVFVLDKKENAYFVPAGFVKSDKTGRYLLTGKSDKGKLYVELGLEGVDRVEVISDQISEGMKIYD